MRNPFLIGPALYLCPMEPEDAAQVAAWINDPEVSRTLRFHRPLTRADVEEYHRRNAGSETGLVLGIVVREGDRFIGSIGLHDLQTRDRHASLGILIGDRDAWGKGHGTEATRLLVRHAFRTLNLNRVWLQVYENNPAARRVYEKAGFRVEGRLRQDTFREGRYWDTLVMGLLREEWTDELGP